MQRLSDIIEGFIKEMIDNSKETELQIQRNELANYFSCAPSQINYVLTTRFTTDRGYYVESKRGGGGCILIRRLEFAHHRSLIDSINERIGDSITYNGGTQIINRLAELEIITERESNLMKIVINDRTLGIVENRNKLRAELLKSMMMVFIL